MSFQSTEEQLKLINRGTEEVIPEQQLIDKLNNSAKDNKPLQVKLG